jgi:hypothetical protein
MTMPIKMATPQPIRIIVPQPDDFFSGGNTGAEACGAIGAPHLGQAAALVLTSLPHSGHGVSATSTPP